MNAQTFISRAKNLHAPSPSVAKLLELLAQPDVDNDDLVVVVQRDGVLSAKLLAVCNSSYYGLAEPVGSVDQAVHYLGYNEIHRLVMAICFSSTLSQTLPGYAIEDQELWQHSLVTGLVSQHVLSECRSLGVEPSIAYTAGLVHDIGKIVLNQALDPEIQSRLRDLIQARAHSRTEAEKAILGVDHSEVGACLLEQWRLPAIIVEAVAHHHCPPLEPRPGLSAVIHVANAVAHEAGSAPGWDGFALRMEERALEALGMRPEKTDMLVVAAYDSLQTARGDMRKASSPTSRT